MKTFFFLTGIILGVLFSCDSQMRSDKKKYDIQGTTWAVHLKGNLDNFIWLSCDSIYIDYDGEIENYYYGKFTIKSDTLILNQKYEDDFHRHETFPIKVKSSKKSKFLIMNDSTLLFLSYDNVKASPGIIYKLEHRFDCNALNNN